MEDDGKPVPKFKPSWRDNVKDFLLYAGAIVGVVSWAYGKAQSWVDTSQFDRYKEDQKLIAKWQDDRARAIEKQVNDSAMKVEATSVRVENIQRSVDRIETKLDEKRRR